jgi:hypothetical protein
MGGGVACAVVLVVVFVAIFSVPFQRVALMIKAVQPTHQRRATSSCLSVN